MKALVVATVGGFIDFEKKDIIHTKDLKFDDISNGSMKHIIRWMIDTGRLKRICVGEYQIGDIESHD